jgi:hypothetical protein
LEDSSAAAQVELDKAQKKFEEISETVDVSKTDGSLINF